MHFRVVEALGLVVFSLILLVSMAGKAARFTSNYPCSDNAKTCVSQGVRVVDGFSVHRDCWEYSYGKACNYPSKNNCRNFAHCYIVAELPCLLRDSYGNCVNLAKEFSCKSWEPVTLNKESVRMGLVAKAGKEKLVCKGLPCIDGNCVNKSYIVDGDMMDSVAKLYAVSQMKEAKDVNFQLFAGFTQSCSKKATSYTNCCSVSLKGWGKNLGAECTKNEIDLVDRRQKNLCFFVGKENKQKMGINVIVKHHYCCFGSLLNKVIQVEGRKQLGISFGSGKNTDCRGLTLAEIMRLDFNKMDFSEFFAELLKRMKVPKLGDIASRVNSSLPNMRNYDGNPANQHNNKAGWNKDLADDSSEGEEERRVEQEKIELARKELERVELARKKAEQEQQQRLLALAQAEQQAKLEAARIVSQRLEAERAIAETARKKLAEEQAWRQPKAKKERQLVQSKILEQQAYDVWQKAGYPACSSFKGNWSSKDMYLSQWLVKLRYL